MIPFEPLRAAATRCGWVLALTSLPLVASSSQRVAVEEVMRRSNDYYISAFPLGNAAWNRGAYHAGNFRAWETLGIQSYYDYAVTWSAANNWTRGPEGPAHADAHCCGQAYIDLFRVDPQSVRVANIKSTMDALLGVPAVTDDWWWIDAFFMAAPTFAKLGVTYNNPAYFAQLEAMYFHMKNTRALFDPAHGLWYRDATAKGRTGANTPEFWGRGNGWVIAACARVLEELPAADPRRPEFVAMLQTMAAALVPLQGLDGFWRSNLKFPNHFSNPETSCTAFFTYAIAYGINEGILDGATYTPVVMKAWEGMTTIALHPSGKLGFVQAIGLDPKAANNDGDQDYGYGALMLAGSEILKLLGGPLAMSADAGLNLIVTDTNRNYVESVTLDGSHSVIRSGSVTRYSWWLGNVYLGEGPLLTISFPLGSHTVSLKAEHSGGETFSDTKIITVNPRPPGNITVSAIGNQAGNPPENTLDGSLATRWSQEGIGQWILYELPDTVTLDHVGIAFYKGNERSSLFDLKLSADGLTWTTAFSGQSALNLNLQTFSFPPQPVRFVRYVGDGTSLPAFYWNSLTEVSIPLPTDSDAADSEPNGLPDSWETHFFTEANQNPNADPDGDGSSNRDEFILGGNPRSYDGPLLHIGRSGSGQLEIALHARAAFGPGHVGKTRRFRVLTSTNLDSGDWQMVPGYESLAGDNLEHVIPLAESGGHLFFKVASWLE